MGKIEFNILYFSIHKSKMTTLHISITSELIGTRIKSIETITSGHIHQSYKLIGSQGDAYILQKINQGAFPNVLMLQDNIQKVLEHIGKRKNDAGVTLTMLHLKNNKSYYLDDEGNYWRVFKYISGSRTYNRVTSNELAREAGKAFGSFLNLLNDFPANLLSETIPDFHNLEFRLSQFEQSILNDPKSRAIEVQHEFSFVKEKAPKMKRILDLGRKNKIPLRVTHNDTKINNVLFDQHNKAICVIDLDTVMPGYLHYDFGDAIRTGAASAEEDEPDLKNMFIDLDLFESYSNGFLEQVIGFLNQTELDELYIAPQILTFTIALRFLTDYLNGDTYFKTSYPEHNLVRWKAQKQLLKSMEQNELKMKKIIQDIITLHQ